MKFKRHSTGNRTKEINTGPKTDLTSIYVDDGIGGVINILRACAEIDGQMLTRSTHKNSKSED